MRFTPWVAEGCRTIPRSVDSGRTGILGSADYKDMHGCACGRPGMMVARRPEANTREWEVDIEHDTGTVHTNLIKIHERPVLVDD